MTLAEKIIQHLQALPESRQAEVLDFVKYLESKSHTQREAAENAQWSTFSLQSAMRGMEDEDSPYSINDLKEVFS